VGLSYAIQTVTLSLDDSTTYASGDVLANTQEITGAFRTSGGDGILKSVSLLDKDDQGGNLDLVFLRSSTALGTENSAINISDTDAEEILTVVSVSASRYIDLVNSQFATMNDDYEGVGVVVGPSSNTTSLFVGAISRDTKAHTSSGIVVSVGILRA
jgi:hypothetical protein